MQLITSYLGIALRSPLVVSASPLSETIGNIKQMADSGAGAVVLYSLFEEQVRRDQQMAYFSNIHPKATSADIHDLFPPQPFRTDLKAYLAHIRQAKDAVNIPIIASLNCTSLGSWTEFAQQIQDAGADALELNIYFIPTDRDVTSEQVEDSYLRIVKAVKSTLRIPLAVKLCPFFSNMAQMAKRLDEAGANALVLFNRFYEPDFDPKTLKVQPNIQLSTSQDLRLPLHWIAILSGYLRADLAASGGVHIAEDVVKMLMVGAKVTMLASVLLKNGIPYLRTLTQGLDEWLEQNDYDSVVAVQGLTRQFNSQDTAAFERSEYLRALTTYRPIV